MAICIRCSTPFKGRKPFQSIILNPCVRNSSIIHVRRRSLMCFGGTQTAAVYRPVGIVLGTRCSRQFSYLDVDIGCVGWYGTDTYPSVWTCSWVVRVVVFIASLYQFRINNRICLHTFASTGVECSSLLPIPMAGTIAS